MNLEALREAVGSGPGVGALIHERTGIARPAEIVVVEEGRVLAVARVDGPDASLFDHDARVRLELPREASVVCAAGRVARSQRINDTLELEIDCPEGAEDRQRRMDVRVDTACRIHLLDGDAWFRKRTVNVSAGGALLADADPVHPGDVVDVELDVPGEPIRCRAEVLHRGVKTGGVSSRTNAALRFVGLPAPQRSRLALWVLAMQAREKVTKKHGSGPRPRPEDDEEEWGRH